MRYGPGETLKSIARRYRISEDDILFYNPGARELAAGTSLFRYLLPADDEELGATETG
jgi:hypothetical protein